MADATAAGARDIISRMKPDSSFRRSVKKGVSRRTLLGAAAVGALSKVEGRPLPVTTPSGAGSDIVLENAAVRLVLSADGYAKSLLDKASGQECLAVSEKIPTFSITQYGSIPGQLTLMYPADEKMFPATHVRRDRDHLFVRFDPLPYEIAIRLNVSPHYMSFKVESVRWGTQGTHESDRQKSAIEELVFLQLPVLERKSFGQWLNVAWDDETAVGVLAGNPHSRMGSEKRGAWRILRASVEDRVGVTGATAILLTARTRDLLGRISEIERDFGLPRGVESRLRDENRYSYYWAARVTPSNIDEHITYARKAGFRMMMISHRDFAASTGHFPWRPEYPRGMSDLIALVQRIRAAGLIPGLHIHYTKCEKKDAYVSGKPDGRLHLRRTFTLAAPLDDRALAIKVEENPLGCTLDEGRRLLKVGDELITYERYTTEPPYTFQGCKRGELNTTAASHPTGLVAGLLDVDTWPIFVLVNQNTTIQEEIAQRIAGLYGAGFEFVYFDGAEDVHAPYWFNTSWAQWVVYRALKSPPMFAEGASRSHFGWHILTGGNGFDPQQPEQIKAGVRRHQANLAETMLKDFTRINFGWIGYVAPDGRRPGTQPDELEYVASRAAGWNCPFSLWPDVEPLKRHPRTPDNLEVMRRWEEVRLRGLLSAAEKRALRNLDQEHTLLLDERGRFELVACEAIKGVAGNDPRIRAFVFERAGHTWIVFWHISGNGTLALPLSVGSTRLFADGNWSEIPQKAREADTTLLPAAGRHYLDCGALSRAEVIRAFERAELCVS